MKYKKLLSYAAVFILSTGVFFLSEGAIAGLMVGCVMSLGCSNISILYFLIPLFALTTIFVLSYLLTKPNPIILFFIVFILPFPALRMVYRIEYQYKYGAEDKLVASAKKHRASIRVKEYEVYTKMDDELVVNVFLPFEVEKPFSSAELPHMFYSSAISDRFPLSSNEACNEALRAAVNKESDLPATSALFRNLYFIEPPRNLTLAQISANKPEKIVSYNIFSDKSSDELQAGRRYYVYGYLQVGKQHCRPEYFQIYNPSSPIQLR